jgi:hypothetical protein
MERPRETALSQTRHAMSGWMITKLHLKYIGFETQLVKNHHLSNQIAVELLSDIVSNGNLIRTEVKDSESALQTTVYLCLFASAIKSRRPFPAILRASTASRSSVTESAPDAFLDLASCTKALNLLITSAQVYSLRCHVSAAHIW